MLPFDGAMSLVCPYLAAKCSQEAQTPSRILQAPRAFATLTRKVAAWNSVTGARCQSVGAHLFVVIALVLFGSLPLWATQTLTFNGVVSVLSTGSNLLSGPAGVVTDTSWNVYIADTGNNRIVKVAADGTVSILNITGLASPSTLSAPKGLATDGSGNLYIADSGNSRIVKVDSSGNGSVVSTGSVSLNLPQGLAINATGNLFISDTGHNQIVEVPATGTPAVYSITGLTSPSTLSSPEGLTVDASGNLYIADSGNSRIVKVTSGGVAAALAITGTTPVAPAGVAIDSYGNLYIADVSSSEIISVTPDLVGANFSDKSGLLNASPAGVAVDLFGNVYIADTGNNNVESVQIKAVDFGHMSLGPSATQLAVPLVMGGTYGTPGPDLTNLTVTTLGNSNLDFRVNGNYTSCVAGTTNLATCNIGVQFLPAAPGLRQGGMILTYFDTSVTPQVTRSITVPLFAFNDAPQAALYPGVASVVGSVSVPTQTPYQPAVDGSGNIYVGNVAGKNVVKINAGGTSASVVSTVNASSSSITLGAVNGVAVDGAGDLFIADNQNSTVYEVNAAGITYPLSIDIAGSPTSLSGPTTLTLDGGGNLFIADNGNNRILKVALQDPTLATTFPLTGIAVNTGGYTFSGHAITGLAVDSSENLYVVDSVNSKIVKITAAGASSVVAFPGLTPALSKPEGVAVDGMGNLYVSDAGNNRIVQLTTAGVASVVPIQGLTSPATLGSGSSAGQDIDGLAVDFAGNIYIADTGNNRVVRVNMSSASLAFADTKVGSTSTDSPKTAMVTNIGDQALVFSSDPTYTSSFSVNSGDANLCASTTSLSPGTSCDVSVKFTPQSVGSLSSNITVTDNMLNVPNAPQRVSVNGHGLTPGDVTTTSVQASPSTLAVGQTTTITATITDTTSGSTTPTGSVSFTDTLGTTTTTLTGSPATLTGGTATLSNVSLVGVGTHTITANYAGVSGSFLSSSNTQTVIVNQATPTISWTPASSITYGATLNGQLNASAMDGSSPVTGSFVYTATPASGPAVTVTSATVLTAGSYMLTATFTPTDTANYNVATSTAPLTVNKATPTVSWPPGASSITYGTTLNGILNASASFKSSSVPGSFAYTATPGGGTAEPIQPAFVLSAGSYTLSVTFTPTDTTNYSTASGTVALTVNKAMLTVSWIPGASSITYGTALGSILNASASFSSSSVPGSFAYTATPSSGSAVPITAVTVLAAGSYSLSTTFTPTDTTNYSKASGTAALTVNKIAATISLVSSANPVLVTNAITFTAMVSSAVSAPPGTVSFYDGTTLLGSVTLSSGTASYTTSSLAAATHSITAVYGGSSNFTSVTSSAVAELVQDFSVSPPSGAGGTPSQTVVPGGTATYSLALGPSNGATFPAVVTLSVSGLPPGATATITPQALPAGSSLTNVTLSIQLPTTTAQNSGKDIPFRNVPPMLWSVLLLPFVGRLRRTSRRLSRMLCLLLLLAGAAVMAGVTGCGSTNGFFGQAPKTYTVTVTATSAGVSRSTNVSLTVE